MEPWSELAICTVGHPWLLVLEREPGVVLRSGICPLSCHLSTMLVVDLDI
jgi:hypothetical protein